uniref:Lin-66-like winged helix domain-containing protein n=1 Tax=Angiostrongylus cantonensis TaxID=6313 RepID=A0A0K0DIR3_ANGCA
MAYEIGGMFAQQPHHPHSIWSSGTVQLIIPGLIPTMNTLMSANGSYVANHHQLDLHTSKAESIQGYGQLTWLSGKAGLITCKNKMVISFQIKDFCDQMLTDLTSVLRVGFTLSFQASLNETNEYTATLVYPLYGQVAEQVFLNAPEVDLEKACPTPPSSKDAYSPVIEARAVPTLLAIFQRHALTQIQLSSLHSQMSNCADDELFRYVGTSSLKRRQFVERRTHLFRLTPEDNIALQSPAVYLCVLRLASYLLRRGGATAIQSLYDYFIGPDMAPEIRDQIGESRQEFLNLVVSHPWIFALFPNRTYVSVRRNLPHYDYPGFIKQHFPDLDVLRPSSARGYGPRPIARSMSAHQPLVQALSNNRSAVGGSLVQAGSRPVSLWDNRNSISQVSRLLLFCNFVFIQVFVNAAVQTEITRSDSGTCTCGCTCGGRGGLSRASGGSASPPSLDSISPSLHDRVSSPVNSAGAASSSKEGMVDPPTVRSYDLFGTTELFAARLGSLRINN